MPDLLTAVRVRTGTTPPFTYDIAEFLSRDVAFDFRLIPEYESEEAAVRAGHFTGQVYAGAGGRFSVVGPMPSGDE